MRMIFLFFADKIEEAETLLHKLEKSCRRDRTLIIKYIKRHNSRASANKDLDFVNPKHVEAFRYLGRNIASTEKDIQIRTGLP